MVFEFGPGYHRSKPQDRICLIYIFSLYYLCSLWSCLATQSEPPGHIYVRYVYSWQTAITNSTVGIVHSWLLPGERMRYTYCRKIPIKDPMTRQRKKQRQQRQRAAKALHTLYTTTQLPQSCGVYKLHRPASSCILYGTTLSSAYLPTVLFNQELCYLSILFDRQTIKYSTSSQ